MTTRWKSRRWTTRTPPCLLSFELLDVEVLCRVPRVPQRVRGLVDAIVDDEVVVVRERPHARPDAGHPSTRGAQSKIGLLVLAWSRGVSNAGSVDWSVKKGCAPCTRADVKSSEHESTSAEP